MHGGVTASNSHSADVAAVSRAVGFSPALSSEGAGWKHAALYAWRGLCEIAHFNPLSEPVLIYHTGGAPVIDVRHDQGRRERSRPGLMTLVPPGAPVDWYIGGDVHSYSLHLGADVFAARSDDAVPLDPNVRFQCGLVDPLLSASIMALADELARPTQRGSLYADAIADVVGLHLLRLPFAIAPKPGIRSGLSRSQLREVLDLLEDSIERGVSLGDLACKAGLSRTYFAEAFQRATGTSPHRYLTQRRIARAQSLLQHSALPLAEIALQCGFCNQAHFSQTFRQSTGTTPSRYRAEVK
ncbi:MAG: AraC family transcriptional regulator [Panacagrimonas sp.]|jgi:AraC family transcriptional regulator|nr:AraC family transcriptional regulator [Panacagrimonas sp.]